MDEISSTEFRRRYAALRKPTTVTVNGHGIGEWHPYLSLEAPTRDEAERVLQERVSETGYVPGIRGLDGVSSLTIKDPATIRFNSQPFRGPIAKKR